VADDWCWFVLREEQCWLVAGGWFVVREKYCWLVADKPSEQGIGAERPSPGVAVQRRQKVLSSPSRAPAVVGAELTRTRIGGGRGRTR
jgi:hypothetical protein